MMTSIKNDRKRRPSNKETRHFPDDSYLKRQLRLKYYNMGCGSFQDRLYKSSLLKNIFSAISKNRLTFC